MMTGLVLLALLNGGLISASRALNGRLGMSTGALHASFWNHIVGFLLLTVLLFATLAPGMDTALDAPPFAYFGGALGTLFVAMNSRVLPRLGAVLTLVLIIGGQMTAGLAIDYLGAARPPTLVQLLAISLIILGAGLARISASRRGPT